MDRRKKLISIALIAAMAAASATTVIAEDAPGVLDSEQQAAASQQTEVIPVQKGWFLHNNIWYYGDTADTLHIGWLLEGMGFYGQKKKINFNCINRCYGCCQRHYCNSGGCSRSVGF